MDEDKPRIGFIGTGVMGAAMAGHLLAAGYPLQVHTRTRGRAQDLITAGAQWRDSPAEVALGSEVVITMVGLPAEVEEVYFGAAGILAELRAGATAIDMTSSDPRLAERIHAAAAERAAWALDAPVSGGEKGAREATLSIMVGGDRQAFEAMLPLLEVLGRHVALLGGPGAGQHTKLANQTAIAAGMLGVCEALAYARRAGLDADAVLESISRGAAASWSLSNLGPRMLAGDDAPGFMVRHFIKDMSVAAASAEELGLPTPGLELALTMYRRLADEGGAELGTQALFRLYERR